MNHHGFGILDGKGRRSRVNRETPCSFNGVGLALGEVAMPCPHRPEKGNTMTTEVRGRKPKVLQITQSLAVKGAGKEAMEVVSNIQEFRVALSVREFRETLGIGKTLFFRLVKEGKIRTIKLGTRTLVPIEQLQTLLAKVAS